MHDDHAARSERARASSPPGVASSLLRLSCAESAEHPATGHLPATERCRDLSLSRRDDTGNAREDRVLLAILDGRISIEEACRQYRVDTAEIERWLLERIRPSANPKVALWTVGPPAEWSDPHPTHGPLSCEKAEVSGVRGATGSDPAHACEASAGGRAVAFRRAWPRE